MREVRGGGGQRRASGVMGLVKDEVVKGDGGGVGGSMGEGGVGGWRTLVVEEVSKGLRFQCIGYI